MFTGASKSRETLNHVIGRAAQRVSFGVGAGLACLALTTSAACWAGELGLELTDVGRWGARRFGAAFHEFDARATVVGLAEALPAERRVPEATDRSARLVGDIGMQGPRRGEFSKALRWRPRVRPTGESGVNAASSTTGGLAGQRGTLWLWVAELGSSSPAAGVTFTPLLGAYEIDTLGPDGVEPGSVADWGQIAVQSTRERPGRAEQATGRPAPRGEERGGNGSTQSAETESGHQITRNQSALR